MNYQVYKYISATLLFLSVLFGTGRVYAADLNAICGDLITNGDTTLSPIQIVCPFARTVNAMLFAAGAVFVVMLIYGGIKLSMALGDPKGMQAAKLTLTWTVIGFLVVVGAITILYIVTRIFGINIDVLNPFGAVADAIGRLECTFGIQDPLVVCN